MKNQRKKPKSYKEISQIFNILGCQTSGKVVGEKCGNTMLQWRFGERH